LQRAAPNKARIEIIPMIDTIFFLLVFFMFSSLQKVSMSAPEVNLPASATAAGKTTKKVVVTVNAAGEYFVDKQPMDLPEILPELRRRIERDDDLVVVINADRNQEVGQIQKLIDIGKQANPAKMFIATAPDDSAATDGEDEATTPNASDVKRPARGSGSTK
jgi:biopolymer transport protein ExbD